MRCKQCGTVLSENAKFCGVCGKKIEEKIVQPQVKTKQETKKKDKSGNQKNGRKKSKGGIIVILLVLSICVVVIGITLVQKKGSISENGKNSSVSKIIGKKQNEEINGEWNKYSKYYKGYIYYVKGTKLCREKMDIPEEKVADKEQIWEYNPDVYIDNFEIYNDIIYIGYSYYEDYYENYENATDYAYAICKINCEGGKTDIIYYNQNSTNMRMCENDIYCIVWPENTEETFHVEKVTIKGKVTKMFDIPEEYDNMYMKWYGKYLYSPDDDEITRIDVTKQKCIKEVAVEKEVAKNIIDDYLVNGDKIYYTDVTRGEPDYGYKNWYEYDMNTKKNREILNPDIFPYSGEEFYIENCIGDNLYVTRNDSGEEEPQKIYCLNLKNSKMKFIRSRYTDNSIGWDICSKYIVNYWENEEGETEVNISQLEE